MGTKNNPGKFDCYANAGPDEPMFVLLGRDKHAPTLIWLWATLREIDGEDKEIVEEARDAATKMIEWAFAHDRKVAGLGVSILAGSMELIRTNNALLKELRQQESQTTPTTVEVVRRFLCQTELEPEEK